MKLKNVLLASLAGIALSTASTALAQTDGKNPQPSVASSGNSLLADINTDISKWWNGSSALGNWFGLGYPLQDHGLTITGSAKQEWYSQTMGGYGSGSGLANNNFVNEEKLSAILNFGKLFDIDGLKGLTFQSYWRYRNVGNNPAYVAGTIGNSSTFNPSADTSGLGVRILPQYLQWQSDSTKDPRFMANIGWENPYEMFLQQPLSKDFMNNNIVSAKGIGATLGNGVYVYNTTQKKYISYSTSAVPWSSSYAAWGGTLRVKPSSSTYVQAGLYEAIANTSGVGVSQYSSTQVYPYTTTSPSMRGATKYSGQQYPIVNAKTGQFAGYATQGWVKSYGQNHGFNFQGSPAFTPNTTAAANQNFGSGQQYSENGLYNVDEIGWTPKLGAAKLEGKYAVGAYIWGQQNSSFMPANYVSPNATSKAPLSNLYNNLTAGMYFQADQRLTAVKEESAAPAPVSKNPVDSKNPVAPTTAAATYSKTRGLYMINEFTFTNPSENVMPVYFQTGLIYQGLLNCRPNDSVGAVIGAGFYSQQYNRWQNSQNTAVNGTSTVTSGLSTLPAYTSTEVVEAYYKIALNKWATFSPDIQWICNPAGNGTVGNEVIVGACAKVTF
jgi:carbohydrate-selective porin OprB